MPSVELKPRAYGGALPPRNIWESGGLENAISQSTIDVKTTRK